MIAFITILVVLVIFLAPLIYDRVNKNQEDSTEKPQYRQPEQQFAYKTQEDLERDHYWEVVCKFSELLLRNTEEVLCMKEMEYSLIMDKVRSVLDERIERPEDGAVKLYFHFQNLQEDIYKWRNERIDAVEMCREICNINFELLKSPEFNKMMFKGMRSSSMTRLCVIEERMHNYERVLEICDWCYDRFIRDSSGDYFEKRAEKMIEKIEMRDRHK